MRPRFAVLASVLTAFAVLITPGVAAAAPKHNHQLTINATPNPIMAGEGVLIYGQLKNTPVSGQTILLYHRVNPSSQFTLIGKATTDSFGFYAFTREEGVVLTNRSWFVRGPDGSHSRTLYERVAALVSTPVASTSTGDTNHPITFTGHVTPNHAFEPVYLQEQIGSSDDWNTLKAGRLGPGSNYSISYRWRTPGLHNVRVVFPGDDRNIRGVSDSTQVTIEQTQVAGFTISTATPVVEFGHAATITGTLDKPGTTTPEPNTPITLCHRLIDQSTAACDIGGSTRSDGTYSFTVHPTNNEVYYAKTVLPPSRRTASLFIGVRDLLLLAAMPLNVSVDQPVLFAGFVAPDQAGDVIYLQRLGADGDWHTVATSRVRSDSTFAFVREFGNPGAKTFRARIPGDDQNVGAASNRVTINVTLQPLASLPPAP